MAIKDRKSPKMEFTPKPNGSKGSTRPKPYASQSTGGYGRNNVRRADVIGFRRVTSAHTTPHRYNNSYKSRTDKILESSSLRLEKDEPTKLNSWLTKKGPSPKRPLAPSNIKAKQKKDGDPYNIFSDEEDTDEEIFLSAKKTLKTTEGVDKIQKKEGVLKIIEGVDRIQKKEGVRSSGLFANKEAKKSLFPNTEPPKPRFYSNKESPTPKYTEPPTPKYTEPPKPKFYDNESPNTKSKIFPNKESPKTKPKFNFLANKENNCFGSPIKSPKLGKTYGSAKRKQFSFSKHNQLRDVSPVKVERLYGEQEVGGSLWSSEANEKENIPISTTSDSLDVFEPHLVGFPNYGNTCYLNAVIQSLLALPSFTVDLQHLTSSLSPDRTSLFHCLGQILHHRDKLHVKEMRSKLKSFKDNVVRVDDSFSGFKMQDANELLTVVLDTIKDEVERCHMTTPSPDHQSTSTERLNLTPEHPGTEQTQCYEPISETEHSTCVVDPFEADLFGPINEDTSDSVQKNCMKESSIDHSDINENERTSVDNSLYELKKDKDFNVNKNSFSSPTKETNPKMCNSDSVYGLSSISSSPLDFISSPSSSPLDFISSPKTKATEYSSESTQITTPKDKSVVGAEKIPRNPVKDNFEFELLESYRCLSCSEVIGRKQEYFGLYVNLPEKDTSDDSFDEDIKLTGEGQTSIQDAIDAYMSADERDLNCEKCGHDKAEVVTSATSLPRILVVQLKRYEYKPEMFESLKVSSRVSINQWISLDKFIAEDVKPVKLCSTECSSIVPKAPKQATLTVRNLASELNSFKGDSKEDFTGDSMFNCFKSPLKKEDAIALPSKSPLKKEDAIALPSADQEDEELQEVMRRSMSDMGGPGTSQGVPNQEEDEIQQAIRLSLQDVGMSFSVENVEDSRDGFEAKNEEKDDIAENRHTYRLMSIISHFGQTTKTGHYVSDVFNVKENSWFHYDDETVTTIKEAVATAGGRQKNGYIFFYIHRDFFDQLQKSVDKGR